MWAARSPGLGSCLGRQLVQYSRELQQGTLSQISPSSSKLLSLGVYHRTLQEMPIPCSVFYASIGFPHCLLSFLPRCWLACESSLMFVVMLIFCYWYFLNAFINWVFWDYFLTFWNFIFCTIFASSCIFFSFLVIRVIYLMCQKVLEGLFLRQNGASQSGRLVFFCFVSLLPSFSNFKPMWRFYSASAIFLLDLQLFQWNNYFCVENFEERH